MLCYMKKCPTIYVKVDTVHITTTAAFGFKSILQNKKRSHQMAALLALIHTHKMLSSFKKKIKKCITYTKNTTPHKRFKSFLFLCST